MSPRPPALLAAPTLICTPPAAVTTATGDDKGRDWKPLFDGKSLDGWEHVGPGRMVLEDGAIRTEGGMGLLWYTREKLGNCTIRIVYKTTSAKSNSGVFI